MLRELHLAEGPVRARRDDDLVLPGLVHVDERDTRRLRGTWRAPARRPSPAAPRAPRRRGRLSRRRRRSVTSAPRRAHATAWFAPFPPGMREKVAPVTVSPGRGRRSQRATRSRLIDPTTTMRGATAPRLRGSASRTTRRARGDPRPSSRTACRGGRRARPRATSGRATHRDSRRRRGPSSARTRTASSRYDRRDAVRAGMDACAVEDRLPFDELSGARPEVPGATLRPLRLELEQVARERLLQAGERGLDAVGGAAKGSLALACRRRHRLSPPPALEQPAERERGDLAGAELAHEPRGRQLARRVALDDCVPARVQTSITTGNTIGRRRVLS